MILNEYTRKQLVNRSKSPSNLNRYSRRLEIANDQISIINMQMIQSDPRYKDILIEFSVKNYIVKLQLVDFSTTLLNAIKYAKSTDKLRTVVSRAITSTMNKKVRVSCTCPDFYYRFSYLATKDDFGFNTNQYIPARIRNPKDQGSTCKHLMRVLNAPSLWRSQVVSYVIKLLKEDPRLVV